MKNELNRIAEALERLSPKPAELPDFSKEGYIWQGSTRALLPVEYVQAVRLEQLVGIERAKSLLQENTQNFAQGKPANHALLWGARGMGKSSLVKAIYKELARDYELTLIEILREDLSSLSELLALLRGSDRRFIVYCDDLSFEYEESVYKSLKAALDGGIAGVPENMIFYATSNRRHLMAREMMDNERKAAIHENEAEEEKISLSDRFGLWLGFYKASQDDYLEMVAAYLSAAGLDIANEIWKAEAIEWQVTRGHRSGRVAWQFAQYYQAKML